jgi:hypothetical protein
MARSQRSRVAPPAAHSRDRTASSGLRSLGHRLVGPRIGFARFGPIAIAGLSLIQVNNRAGIGFILKK